MNVARFIAFCRKLEYGRSECIFAYISMTTRARDFKFAGTPVQRLQLAMVALTQKLFSAQYAWFSRGGSHLSLVGPTDKELLISHIDMHINANSMSIPFHIQREHDR